MNIAARPEPPVLVEHAQTVRYALEETSHSLCRTPPKTNSQMIQEFERSHNSGTELIPALLARRTGAEVRRRRYIVMDSQIVHQNRAKPNATRFQSQRIGTSARVPYDETTLSNRCRRIDVVA